VVEEKQDGIIVKGAKLHQTGAVCYLTESMHGVGSPQAQKIMIGRTANIERMKGSAKRLCGITG